MSISKVEPNRLPCNTYSTCRSLQEAGIQEETLEPSSLAPRTVEHGDTWLEALEVT
jgi:hypothetical protein